MSENTKLSSSITVSKYKLLVKHEDRKALGEFLIERFNERYFEVFDESTKKHGFTLMAVFCIVIETLESFYQGRSDTRNQSARMFKDFFARNTKLSVLASDDNWFYKNIRCGILHQSESRDGWRILRSGELLNSSEKTINASKVLSALRKAVQRYAEQLETDDVLWTNFCKKMDAVCKNCA